MSTARIKAFLGALLAAVFVTAPAAARCTITNLTSLSFGVYDPTDTVPVDSEGELSIECDEETVVMVQLGRGRSGSQTPRELRYRQNSLSYDIYVDAARTTPWGDGTGGTDVFRGLVPQGRALTLSVYGRIFPRQTVSPGTYTDRIIVVVIF